MPRTRSLSVAAPTLSASLEATTLEELRRLPVVETTWLGARRAFDVPIDGDEEVELCFWFDPDSGQVRAMEIVPRGTDPQALGRALQQAMATPAAPGVPARPTRLAVARREEDATLRELSTALDIGRHAGFDMSVAEQIVDFLEDQMAGGPGFSFLDREDVDLEAVGCFHVAAAAYAARAPWKKIPDDELVRITGLEVSPIHVSVLGMAEEVFGAGIYLTEEAARKTFTDGRPEVLMSQPLLHFDLAEEDECGPSLRAEALQHGWALPKSGRLPVLMRLDRGEDDLNPTNEEIALATDILTAMAGVLPSKDAVSREVPVPSGRRALIEWPVELKMPPRPKSGHVLQMKITLKGSKPAIWRRIVVPAETTLEELHVAIQRAMGWDDQHLYGFCVGDRQFGDGESDEEYAADVTLDDLDLKAKAKMSYNYDFGDDWLHDIVVEKVLPREAKAKYPACTGGEGACPPEDCGGIYQYYQKLDILADRKHEDYPDVKHDFPRGFASDKFDAAAADRRMRKRG